MTIGSTSLTRQTMPTSTPTQMQAETQGCIDMVMHSHDLAGNQRIRDNVDNGCFETWYLTETMLKLTRTIILTVNLWSMSWQ